MAWHVAAATCTGSTISMTVGGGDIDHMLREKWATWHSTQLSV